MHERKQGISCPKDIRIIEIGPVESDTNPWMVIYLIKYIISACKLAYVNFKSRYMAPYEIFNIFCMRMYETIIILTSQIYVCVLCMSLWINMM